MTFHLCITFQMPVHTSALRIFQKLQLYNSLQKEGSKSKIVTPGLHFKLSFFQRSSKGGYFRDQLYTTMRLNCSLLNLYLVTSKWTWVFKIKIPSCSNAGQLELTMRLTINAEDALASHICMVHSRELFGQTLILFVFV